MKPGYKTSEFWVTAILPGVITILNSVFGWGLDWQALVGMFASSGSYAVSRGLAKQ